MKLLAALLLSCGAAFAAPRCTEWMAQPDRQAPLEAHVREGFAAKPPASLDQAVLHLCRGYLAEMRGQLREAFEDYDAAVRLGQGDPELANQALALRGELHYTRGAFEAAQRDLQAAHRNALARRDDGQRAYTLNALANLYSAAQVGRHEQALAMQQELQALHEARGNQGELATAHFNRGSTLGQLKRVNEAMAAFEEALRRYRARGDAASVAETQRAMASLLLKDGQVERAWPLADAAVRSAEGRSDRSFLAQAQLVRAKLARHRGDLEAAQRDLNAAQAQFEREDNPRALERLLDERAALEAQAGRWAPAYAARSRQRELLQQLQEKQNEELSSRMRAEFDTERAEQRSAQLQQQANDARAIQRLQAAVLVLGALLLAGLLGVAWRLSRQARAMRHLALSDELTGLPNRRAVLQKLDERLRSGEPLALLIFDIDHFKRINDRLGHDVGDAVLREVAQAARAALQQDAQIGRIGGEEFLVLLAPDALAAQAERLRGAVEALHIEPGAVRPTISLGGASLEARDAGAEDLLKRADLALYEAKEGGRNRVVLR